MVSEKPIYNNFVPIPTGSDVYIIETQYVKFNPITFGEEVSESDADRFISGKLLENSGDAYTVQITSSDDKIIRFSESPRSYFFRKQHI